jgi:arginase
VHVRLIVSPYDSGLPRRRMGCGPDRLLAAGVMAALEADGHSVDLERIELDGTYPSEIAGGFAIMRAVAEAVRGAMAEKVLPVVLAGNCNTTVGAVAGQSAARPVVLWLDAHGDINTPETSETGFLDGMGVAILTGRAWQRVATGIPGFRPLADARVVLGGTRDLDEDEVTLLARSAIRVVDDAAIRTVGAEAALGPALDALAEQQAPLHLHLDLDVHDAQVAPANHFRPPGGLTPEQVGEAIESATSRLPLAALAVTAYDPAVDPTGVTAEAAIGHIRRAVAGAAKRSGA